MDENSILGSIGWFDGPGQTPPSTSTLMPKPSPHGTAVRRLPPLAIWS